MTPIRSACLLAAGLLLGACGDGFSGTYTDELGMTQYEFDGDGRVYMTVMGMESAGDYQIDGERIVMEGPNGSMVLRRDGDNLMGPMGLKLIKQEEE